ncbi:Beta-TrCP (transducin repeats containing)/Slimb protein [Phytophthora cinnamomi]|uniref:Beta-TrCP (transducin repeats containing)/Slimb protein n=1 Tax=Phytophthora cinnamomi TaxID=4785 RepID=UPI00355A22A6|nr:Beta-TrCP (transducin repeats containing)/Slimb protein [Phytophthora cinnamomi]
MEEGGVSAAGGDADSRARELRRRVANRRHTGAAILNSLPLAQPLSLPQLFYAKHEAHEIRMQLIDMQSLHNTALTYCDQQFVVEKNVRKLRKGIGVTQLQIREKTEELDELQRRVLRMTKMLHDSSDEKTFAKTNDYTEAIKSIFTIAPGNEHKLLDELQAAVNSRSRTVDSQFLSGFMQRYERHHYIEQVSRFIVSMHPQLEAKVEAIVSRFGPGMGESEGMDDQEQQPQSIQQISGRKKYDDLTDDEKVAERRRQFHFRIAEIRNDLKKAEYNVQWCKDRQIDLVALIRAADARIVEKQAELERARMFKGQQMDSDVFENGLQRFFTKELVVALEDEIEIDQLYILDTKAEIVKTLHGHQDSVLDIQFDRTRLMSMSADGKLFLWYWQTRDGIGADRKKYHILGAGETLRSLSLMYRTSIQKLLQWNSIPDSTKTYLGQKLVVEVDANASASDELKTLDLSSSVQFGKLSYENLDFVTTNKNSKDVESQWAAQRLAMLAKEYFPALEDEDKTGEVAPHEEEEDASDADVAMDFIAEEEDGDNENDGEEDEGDEKENDRREAGNNRVHFL